MMKFNCDPSNIYSLKKTHKNPVLEEMGIKGRKRECRGRELGKMKTFFFWKVSKLGNARKSEVA